ncbi:transcription factor HES-2 [Rhinatrema bivittatum]|uniref:transcription factor HES-2 n=1 Tax=Rhinatrema bivittatum TaxID=194408 RepID=UPI00112B2B7D|nr:transcription factor HES-2 [Rhinatrema bivittatum]
MSPRVTAPGYPARSRGVPKRNGQAPELRKTLKPLMEKRRRARINESLNQLKTLILPLIGKDSSRYSKLEKADILELTVRFLRELPAPLQLHDSSDSYREGYRACMTRLSHLLAKKHLLDGDTCARLLDHLQRCPEPSGCSTSKEPGRSSRLVLHLHPGRRAELPSSSASFQHLHRPLPAQQTSTGFIWRPW